MAAAPSFLDYLTAQKVHPWLSDLAGEALAAHRALDPTVVNRLADAFAEYVGHDYSCEKLAGLVRAQGYQVRELPGLFFTVLLPGGEATVFVTGESEVPYRDDRTVALGPWNISVHRGVEYVPYFAAGMFTWLDPTHPKVRQQRIDYHWPDEAIPGR